MKYNKATKQQRVKTLCTLDTSDIAISNQLKQTLQYKNRTHKSNGKKKKNSIISVTSYKNPLFKPNFTANIKNLTKQSKEKYKLKSEAFENVANSTKKRIKSVSKDQIDRRYRISSSKNPNKGLRIKTQHYPCDQLYNKTDNKILLQNLQIFTPIKNINFQMDQNYNLDPYYLIRNIKSTQQQTISIVKYLDNKKKVTYYLMKKSSQEKTIHKYQKQIAIKEIFTDLLKTTERKNLSTIYKIYPKQKDDNKHFILVYYLEGENLSWKNDLHKKLIQNFIKNKMEIFKHIVIELAKAIYVLSSYGYFHSQIRLKNILLDIEQDNQNVKVSKNVKLANLSKCLKISDKKSFMKMSLTIHTPPQIINFHLFQQQNKHFDRQLLDCLYKYNESWRVNVWSLGVLILQVLNQKPFPNSYSESHQILQGQNHLIASNKSLFDKICDHNFSVILKKMLSINPFERPSPQQIIMTLTS